LGETCGEDRRGVTGGEGYVEEATTVSKSAKGVLAETADADEKALRDLPARPRKLRETEHPPRFLT